MLPDEPYIEMKVIVLDFPRDVSIEVTSGISNIHWELPRSIRAFNPEEVGTVFLIKWSKEFVRWYQVKTTVGFEQTKFSGSRWRTEVIVINTKLQRRFKPVTIFGADPPEEAYILPADLSGTESKIIVGKPPINELTEFILNLPITGESEK